MKQAAALWTLAMGVVLHLSPASWAGCQPDSVAVGNLCVDQFEASGWEILATNPKGKNNATLITKIKAGIATLAAFEARGAIQRGLGLTVALSHDHFCSLRS